MIISIHALAKRATAKGDIIKGEKLYFNPRPRKEGDTFELELRILEVDISIHALAKRATKSVIGFRQNVGLFQSTPSQRGRPPVGLSNSNQIIFQSTPSQRGRPTQYFILKIFPRFQSTPSQRGRLAAIL